jgi:integrase/recombinase XerD
VQEIGGLYNAVQDNTLGLRDKAMLALYYGCGLRKQEGISLNTVDILLDKDLIHVRKGKGYKARFVPISGQQKTDLENYLNYGRPYLQNLHKKEEALLLSIRGQRMSGATAFERIQNLKAIAGIDKPIGLHTLRHSIATHLLKSGMKLEQIQRLLGHSSMESTQIYTHITHEATL